ncbi:MAG: zinc-binding dehydrogenase [Bdellovibrionales bacterium]|nr:zinc-binding dehydrogenase [Bdellovibrionales bacterium]
MRALVLTRKGEARRAFELRELPDPKPADDEVLIETEFSGVNFADVMARLGLYPDAPPLPCVLGYEVVGTIRSLGNQVGILRPDLQVGQRVVALTRFGGYASMACPKAIVVFEISKDTDGAEATAMATQGATAYLAAEECARLQAGDRVLIHAAAGGVGLFLVQLAQRRECQVIATAGSEEKLDLLRKQFAVDLAINYRRESFVKKIRSFANSKTPIDVVFDSIGGSVYHQSRQLLAPLGRMVSLGVAEMTSSSPFRGIRAAWSALQFGWIHPLTLLDRSQSLTGLNVLRVADLQPGKLQKAFVEIQSLVRKGDLQPFVGASFPIREVGAAHELLASRQSVGKIALRW